MDSAQTLYAAAVLAGLNRRQARRNGNKAAERTAERELIGINRMARRLNINPMTGR